MSSKINVKSIIYGHFATLRSTSGKVSFSDFITFLFVPAVFFVLVIVLGFNLNKDIVSLLVNFGAIFTALLLSVLVLVYDQESKLDERQFRALRDNVSGDIFYLAKKELLGHLYINISYSIICSLFLIAMCFLYSIADVYATKMPVNEFGFASLLSRLFVTPVVVFLVVHLLLTIVMLVKRLHALLIMNR